MIEPPGALLGALPGALLGAGAGAIAGSFLATLILRWPNGRGVARGRSACDGCGRELRPIELVPMLSAVALKGQCRSCRAPINPLHGRVEAGCAIIGALAMGFMPGAGGIGWAVLGWVLLTLAVLDARHFWLPDALTLPLAFLGLTIGLWATDVAMADRIIGAVGGYLALLALSLGYRAMRGRDGLGLGDAKLLGALGAWFGWQALPFILLIGSGMGLLAIGAVMATGRSMPRATRVPLGTLLAIGAVPGWLVARWIA